jgi:sigma-B regulation protein RsbQ
MNVLKRNNVKTSGNGDQHMIFAHGFVGDHNLWKRISPSFENDYKVILFDYVGCGLSDHKAYNRERYSTLEGYSQDIIEICQELNIRDAVFVGHSVSSMIGLLASLRVSDLFSKMVFIAPSPCYLNIGTYRGGFEKSELNNFLAQMDEDYSKWATQTIPGIVNPEGDTEVSREIVKSLLSADQMAIKRFALTTFFSDHRSDLLGLTKPCLILQPAEDEMAPTQVGDYLHAHLKTSTLQTIKTKGHYPHLNAPREVIRHIKKFLLNESTVSSR